MLIFGSDGLMVCSLARSFKGDPIVSVDLIENGVRSMYRKLLEN